MESIIISFENLSNNSNTIAVVLSGVLSLIVSLYTFKSSEKSRSKENKVKWEKKDQEIKHMKEELGYLIEQGKRERKEKVLAAYNHFLLKDEEKSIVLYHDESTGEADFDHWEYLVERKHILEELKLFIHNEIQRNMLTIDRKLSEYSGGYKYTERLSYLDPVTDSIIDLYREIKREMEKAIVENQNDLWKSDVRSQFKGTKWRLYKE